MTFARALFRIAPAVVAAVSLTVGAVRPITVFAETTTITATVDDTSAIAACSLIVDDSAKTITPVVTLQAPFPAVFTHVRFSLYDATGGLLGVQDVNVPPPQPVGLQPALPSFAFAQPFAAARCDLKQNGAAPAPSAAPAPGSGGGGSGILLLGILGGGALVALAAGHGGGGGGSSATQAPTHNPTQAPTQTPVPTSTPTPTASPTPVVTATPVATPTPTPTVTPASGIVVLTPPALTFNATGAAFNQNTTASETGYAGAFSVTGNTCAGIATISPTTSSAQFTVTPVNGGSCSFTISDSHGHSATLNVGVTTSTGVVQVKKRHI